MDIHSKSFLLGPFVVSHSQLDLCGEGVDATGYALQFSTENDHYIVPIFKKESSFSKLPTTLDFLFQESSPPPVSVYYSPSLAKRTSKGQFIGITYLIAALYEEFAPATPLHELLDQFSTHCQFQCLSPYDAPRCDILKESLWRLGYAVGRLDSDGDSVRLDLCWIPKVARDNNTLTQNISAGVFQFRPRHDGTLGKGSCPELWEVSIQLRLFEGIRAAGMRHPIDSLSENGIEQCLSVFEWQPKHRMTRAELHEKRLQFVKNNASLWTDPKALSISLKQEGLYSAYTSETQIAKTVKAMIAKLPPPAERLLAH
jgi:hypothetical protein